MVRASRGVDEKCHKWMECGMREVCFLSVWVVYYAGTERSAYRHNVLNVCLGVFSLKRKPINEWLAFVFFTLL